MVRVFGTYLVALGAVAMSGGAVRAEPHTPPPPREQEPPREGFMLGLGFGGGSLALKSDLGEDQEDLGSIFFALSVGGMLTPRAALLVELWGNDHSEDRCDFCYAPGSRPRGEKLHIGQGNAGLALQYWITSRLWLKGGLGTSRLSLRASGKTLESRRGTAFLAAVGYELFHEAQYAIDLHARFTAADYEKRFLGEFDRAGSGAIQIAFTWF